MKYIAIGAGALVVAVALGWAALNGSSAKQTEPATSVTAPAAVVQEQQIVQQAETTPNAEPINASADTVVTEDVSTAAKPKPQIADTRAAPQKTPKPAVKNEAKPAKKLTVDDLIN